MASNEFDEYLKSEGVYDKKKKQPSGFDEYLKSEKSKYGPGANIVADEDMPTRQQMIDDLSAMGTGALEGATYGYADEIYGAGKTAISGGKYEDNRDEARRWLEAQRNKAPNAARGGEFIGAVLSPINKFLPVGVKGSATAGALYAGGKADTIDEVPGEALAGAGLGAATHGALELAKMPFARPTEIRARNLGASDSDFMKKGKFGVEEIIPKVKKMGALKPVAQRPVIKVSDNRVDFKFKPDRKLRPKENLRPEQIIVENIDRGIDAAHKASRSMLDRFSGKKEFTPDMFLEQENGEFRNPMVQKAFDGLVRKLDGNPIEKHQKAYEIIKDELSHLSKVKQTEPGVFEVSEEGSTLSDLADLKSIFQKKGEAAMGIPEPNSQAKAQMYEDLGRAVRQEIENRMPPSYKELNDIQYNLLSQKRMLSKRLASLKSGSKTIGEPQTTLSVVNPTYAAAKGAGTMGKSYPGANIRAGIGDAINKIPHSARVGIQKATETLPGANINEFIKSNKREPQSIPSQLIDVKFPRDTQWIKDNKDMVLMKTAQVRPDLLETVEEAYNMPEQLDNLVPMFVGLAPEMFEMDKYNRVDGKIQEPQMRMLARKDLLKDDTLSNTEKYLKINKLNKTGELND